MPDVRLPRPYRQGALMVGLVALASPVLADDGGLNLHDFWRLFSGAIDTSLVTIDGQPVTIRKILVAAGFLLGGVLLSRILATSLERTLRARTELEQPAVRTVRAIILYTLVAFFIFSALHIANIPLTVFTVVGGALAIGVGFGSQNIINNFVSGVIIRIQRPVRLGDYVELVGTGGTVERIGPRSTTLRTLSNTHLIIPNSKFLENEFINWTLSDKVIRTSVAVGVAYGSPTRETERIILESVSSHDKVLRDPSPYVLFMDFGDSALIFEAYFWVNMSTVRDRRMVASDIRYAIDANLKTAGITIAFPQRDVHLDTDGPIDVRMVDVETRRPAR